MERTDPGTEREAMAVIEDALELPSDQRSQFIRSRSSLSKAARKRALALLEGSDEPAPNLLTGGASAELEDEFLPDRIGPYRILRLIGRGGMGNVYLAEQVATDFDHAVAIKVIKQSLLSPHLIERFRGERQILADLNHPNIARLFDGGETKAGAPYFVMEFVEGVPVSRWLEQAHRSLRQRMEVYRQICKAVEAAHQRLIIHRDLTPSNVLITQQNTVKVIDFGIARSEDAEGANDNKQFAHTPGFCAPEQMSESGASTLSDVYALGKLLEVICDDEMNDEIAAIAKQASAEVPDRRYSSVSALIEDIDNFHATRPVSAFGHGFGYAALKFAKRQKALVGASVLTLATVLAALIIVTQAYRETTVAYAEAEQNLSNTRALASTMMFDVFDEVSNRPGNSRARLMLAENAQEYLEELASDPNATVEARLAAGQGFYRLAAATGTFEAGNYGDIEAGIGFYERSLGILQQLHQDAPSDEVAIALARTHTSLARDKLFSYTDLSGAVDHAEKARQLMSAIAHRDAEALAELGRAERYLGDALACCNGEVEEGVAAIRRGLRHIADAPMELRVSIAVRRAHNDLANLNAGIAIFLEGDDAGIAPFRRALAAQRQLVLETDAPEDHRLEATIASNLARTLVRMDETEEARTVMEPTYQAAMASYQADPDDNDLRRRLAISTIVMGRIAAESGNSEEASRLIANGVGFARSAEWPDGLLTVPSLNYAHRLQEASQAYQANEETEQACRLSRQSLDLYLRYAELYELPVTSLRYRIAPLREQLTNCGGA